MTDNASTLTFRIMTLEAFPRGLGCATCDRTIAESQPYAAHPYAVDDDGNTLSILTCVYCQPPNEQQKRRNW